MKKSFYTLSITATLLFASFAPAVIADASKLSELQTKKNQIANEKSDLNADINEVDEKINSIQTKKQALEQEKRRIDLAIVDTNNKMVQKSQEIDVKKDEIKKLELDIAKTIERIAKRNELLKERARSLQENGGSVNYLDVLMGAQTFGDFIDRLGAVATIMEADQDILKQHNHDKQSLESSQVQVKNELDGLETMKSELQTMNAKFNAQSAEKETLMAELKQEENQVNELRFNLEEEAKILASQQASIQQLIKQEEQRLAAEARPNPGAGGPVPGISSGFWTRPAAGYISSGYGPRSLYGRNFHYGVDIAQRGSVPIVAAADGIIFRSQYHNSYGNHIMITHYNNGQVFTTVYAHMSSLSVGVGATVKKGQQIGYMGSTGDSTGQHLHFEVHIGPYKYGSAVNPTKYVPL